MSRFVCHVCGSRCAMFEIVEHVRTGYWDCEAYCLHCGSRRFLGGGSRKEAESVLATYRALECFACGAPLEATQLWRGGFCGSCTSREVRDGDEWKEKRRYRRPPPGSPLE